MYLVCQPSNFSIGLKFLKRKFYSDKPFREEAIIQGTVVQERDPYLEFPQRAEAGSRHGRDQKIDFGLN